MYPNVKVADCFFPGLPLVVENISYLGYLLSGFAMSKRISAMRGGCINMTENGFPTFQIIYCSSTTMISATRRVWEFIQYAAVFDLIASTTTDSGWGRQLFYTLRPERDYPERSRGFYWPELNLPPLESRIQD